MVNSFRTLLINRPAEYFSAITNATYIPAEYKQVALPSGLADCRDILFAPGIDAWTAYRNAEMYIRLTHSPDLLRYVTALDSRLTYLDKVGTSTDLVVPVVTITGQTATSVPGYKVIAANRSKVANLTGEFTWQLQSNGTTSVDLVIPGRTTVTTNIVSGTLRSKSIELIPNYLYAYFTLPTGTIAEPFKYTYSCVVPSVFDYVTLESNMARSSAVNGSVLYAPVDDAIKAALVAELKTIHDSTSESLVRLATMILAYGYQVDNLRAASGN